MSQLEINIGIKARKEKSGGIEDVEPIVKRECLKCNRKFSSKSKFHKICNLCKDTVEYQGWASIT